MTEYEIKRSKRKTIEIHITSDGRVEVRCPMRVNRFIVDEFVKSKEKWIEKHLTAINNRCKTPLEIGGKMLFLGKEYPICENESRSYFDGETMYIQKDADIYAALAEFYRIKAKELIPPIVHRAESRMGMYANKISITSATTRWGSCSDKNNLNFSWRLMLAEPETIEYVTIHELSHIKEKNHGKRFWQLVERYMLDFKVHKEKLRQLAERLNSDGWE